MDALRRNTPADGVVAGTASINGDLFDDEASRAMVVHYDYTVDTIVGALWGEADFALSEKLTLLAGLRAEAHCAAPRLRGDALVKDCADVGRAHVWTAPRDHDLERGGAHGQVYHPLPKWLNQYNLLP